MRSRLDPSVGGWQLLAWACLLGLLLTAAGCSRAFYRGRADREVYTLVDRASEATCGDLEDYTIQPSSQSRMFDPSCPDRPPMPPDDPTSHRLMHCVDCKPGWPWWHRNGCTTLVENPDWRAYLPHNDKDQVVLNREGAMELALLNSREYQRELEDLYLSALDVTLERFRFDAQFFGGNSTFFTSDGPLHAGGRQSLLETDTDLKMNKLFATGAELAVGVANSLVWQFAGPDQYNANTLLDFSIMQPLLRAGGRAVVLEALTDAERALLANARQMERFRRGFYVQIVAGRSAGPGPARGGPTLDAGGTPLRAAGGYLGLLAQQVRIRNQRANVTGLADSLRRLEAFYDAGRIEAYQVSFTRQRLFDTQTALLSLTTDYENQLDSYKITLGLPPDLEVEIKDPLLARFDLIDPSFSANQDAVAALLAQMRDQLERAAEAAVAVQIDPWQEYGQAVRSICAESARQLQAVEQDLQKLVDALPARRQNLQRLASREEVRRGDIDPMICSVAALERRVALLQDDFTLPPKDRPQELSVRDKIKATLAALDAFPQSGPADTGEAALRRLIDLVDRLSSELLELSLIQAGARLDTATLTPVEIDPARALATARTNRRDWMNARAALVDAWRQIEVTANDLESDLDVTFSGDISTTDNNPVRFRDSTGRLRVGLEFDAPLTRLAERNTYRESLISYQQARREYYAFEDRVNESLRGTIRAIRLNQLNFEVQRAAVFVAIAQVDEARLRLTEPGDSQLGVNTARNLVDGLRDLLTTQNDFLNIWVNQEALRMVLDLDLGTMELDSRGTWLDPGPIEETDQQDAEQTPPPTHPAEPPDTPPVPGEQPPASDKA